MKLIFDEVKTGATIASGGATQRFGVSPDMVTLAKAICGGYPGGAIGMTEELAELVAERHGPPVRHLQRQPAGDGGRRGDADRGADRGRLPEARGDQRAAARPAADEIIERYGLPAYTEGMGAKGCVIFAPEPLREYRDYLTKVDDELATLAWLYHMNHGIFMTPGRRGGVDALDRPLRRGPAALRRRVRGVRARRHRRLSRRSPMAGGPSIRLYRAEWSTNCERVGLALAHKGIEVQSVLIDYADRSAGRGGQRSGAGAGDRGRRRGRQRLGRDPPPPRAPLPSRRCSQPTPRAGRRSTCSSTGSSASTSEAPNTIEASSSGDEPDLALVGDAPCRDAPSASGRFERLLDRPRVLDRRLRRRRLNVAYPFLDVTPASPATRPRRASSARPDPRRAPAARIRRRIARTCAPGYSSGVRAPARAPTDARDETRRQSLSG